MSTAGPVLPQPVAGLLPHRPPMLLVSRLLRVAPDGLAGTVEATLGPDSLLATADGRLEPVAGIELIAQAYGAVRGWAPRDGEQPPRAGFLVGIGTMAFPDLPGFRLTAPTRLEIEVRSAGSFAGFEIVEGEVRAGDRCLAAGGLKVWVPGDEHSGAATTAAAPGDQ